MTSTLSRPRLAILGCGSSGLICLKTALAELPGWEVVCLEKSNRITGCWGHPYPGFVSTSTKYTTQFACFPERDASVEPDGGRSRAEFYREAEYGEYLSRFATTFQLHAHIKLSHSVERLSRVAEKSGWSVTYRATTMPDCVAITEHFDAVVVCTGLAAHAKEIESEIPRLSLSELNSPSGITNIRQERIVVFGGGESAVDFATRLANPELGNKVFLSIRTGVRVSPRFHPIRGIPSDFLRNRLMLSIHPALRNWIGERFVRARILHQERFEKWFPSEAPLKTTQSEAEQQIQSQRKEWAFKLTQGAKDDLFNMFHNKSDDFLECVARGQIQIVGPPVNSRMESFLHFLSTEKIRIQPTKILPAIGYQSTFRGIAGDSIKLTDFYLGCCHVTHPDLFLIGFARPIIGNIPTISEMQATYVCGLISGRFTRPAGIADLNACNQRDNAVRFSKLDLEAVHPVEMFTYCDQLARNMGCYPSLRNVRSLVGWWRMQLTPVTTMHYWHRDPRIRQFCERAPVYMPTLLVVLLLLLKPLDWIYRTIRWIRRQP